MNLFRLTVTGKFIFPLHIVPAYLEGAKSIFAVAGTIVSDGNHPGSVQEV
tara:strand:+ start:278 stop:427 length:150 start_codon:yes stop_codon:yes gene_type:complete